jgi:hypothetical protein
MVMKIALWGLGILLVMPLGGVAGQEQSTQQSQADPVVEAARRAREQKKDQAKATHVWNDENIPKTNGVSVVGEDSAAGAAANGAGSSNPAIGPATAPGGTPGPAAAVAGPGAPAENAATVSAELNSAKEHLKSLQTDLDILQRKYVLDQQMYLSKPEHENDKEGAAQMQDEEDQISAKQQDVADAQKKVDELQAKLTALTPAPTPNPN